MSWESHDKYKPCRCGLGFIVETTRSDDWNRFEYSTRLECPECRKNYVTYIYDYISSGMYEQATCWVDRQLYDTFQKKEERLKETKSRLTQQFNEHMRKEYLDKWVALFEDSPYTKKAVWEKFKKYKLTSYSYKTFCSKTDKQSLSQFVENQVLYENRYLILSAIGVESDSFLESYSANLMEHQKARDNARREMMQSSFR